MTDKDWKSSSRGDTPEALFREFESHDITPAELARMHFVWVTGRTGERYDLYATYSFGNFVELKVQGPNRMIVDGIGSAFDRIADRIASGVPTNATSTREPAESREGWIAKTWREHTVSAVIALVVTVAGSGIAAYFGFN